MVTLPFYLLFFAWLAAAMNYICTNFGVDSSSCFPFRVQTQSHRCNKYDLTDTQYPCVSHYHHR